ncbi:MAG: hypothetical protein RLY19_844 [Actinomycetota bacterium]
MRLESRGVKNRSNQYFLITPRAALLSRQFAVVWAVITALYIYGWVTRWTFDPATTSTQLSNSYFTEQARSILQGHLWINPQAHPWECFYVGEKCYGYFGIAPSLFRIPLVIVGGSRVEENAAFFIALACGIATWAAVDLCRRMLDAAGGNASKWAPWTMASGAMLLGPAGLLLLLIDPYVYQESLAWSLAGTLVAVNCLFRWWHTHSSGLLVVATTALVVAAGARPTAAFVGVFAALGFWFSSRKDKPHDSRTRAHLLALALVPIVATFGVLMLKFGSPMQPFDSYESRQASDFQFLETINPGLKNGVEIMPTSLFAYMRPDAIRFDSSVPFVKFRFGNPRWGAGYERITYLPPLPDDYLYVERTTSLVVLAPLGVAAVFLALAIAIRRPREKLALILLSAVSIQPALMTMTFGVTMRYLVDFYPLIAVSIAVAIARTEKLDSLSHSRHRVLGVTLILLTAWSMWVIPALATQDARIYLFGIASR